jgi:hypothetical protein
MNLQVPQMGGISWLAERTPSFSKRTLLHGVSLVSNQPTLHEAQIKLYQFPQKRGKMQKTWHLT